MNKISCYNGILYKIEYKPERKAPQLQRKSNTEVYLIKLLYKQND